jgi:hypothetical protein
MLRYAALCSDEVNAACEAGAPGEQRCAHNPPGRLGVFCKAPAEQRASLDEALYTETEAEAGVSSSGEAYSIAQHTAA